MSAEDEATQVRAIASSVRFYEHQFPPVDTVVMAQVFKVEPVGVMVSLLEYQGLPGMILASELSRRRFRSIKQVIAVGKVIPCTVIRVDQAKGFIDLSKKRVSPNDAKQIEDRYAHSRAVHSIMSRVAFLTQSNLEELYKNFCWDLYKQYEHAFYAFNAIANNDITVLEKYTEEQLPTNVKETLVSVIKQKMSPKPASIYARIEATCFGAQGVYGLKEAFKAGIACSTEDAQLRIRIVGPPIYVITTTCNVPSKGLVAMKAAIAAITEHLAGIGGKCICPNGPQMTDQDLDIARLAAQDGEDDGDDDEDDEEDDDEDDEDE